MGWFNRGESALSFMLENGSIIVLDISALHVMSAILRRKSRENCTKLLFSLGFFSWHVLRLKRNIVVLQGVFALFECIANHLDEVDWTFYIP